MRFKSLALAAPLALALLSGVPSHAQIMVPPIPRDEASLAGLTQRAEAGSISAQTELGEIYLFGRGFPKDYAKAEFWLTKAAEQGGLMAQRDLGLMYLREAEVQDYAKAQYWLQKAADAGSGAARYLLSSIYAKGLGVPQDKVLAYMWMALSIAATEDEVSGSGLSVDALAADMTPEQIAEAKQKAEAWTPGSPAP